MALTGVDHKRLVEAHLDGDEDAFAAIVRAYYESLFAHAMRRTGDAHAAEDAVQETLFRAYRALPRFSGDYEMRAWLHRILTNVCHDEGRRRRRESHTIERVAAGYTEVPPVDQDLAVLDLPRREVLDALAALPASYRDALVLRYVDELSFHDVAEVSGISEGNARLRVHRGRAALRRALAPFAGVIVFLAPLLRRGQRVALAAQVGAESHVGMVASAPVAARVAESGMTVVDKAPSLPSVIGVAASLVMPAALPVIGDHVVSRVSPPAAVAAPFDAEPGDAERQEPPGGLASAAPASAGVGLQAITTIPPLPVVPTTTPTASTTSGTTARPAEVTAATPAKASGADDTVDPEAISDPPSLGKGADVGGDAEDPEGDEGTDGQSSGASWPTSSPSAIPEDEEEAVPVPAGTEDEGLTVEPVEPDPADLAPSDGTAEEGVVPVDAEAPVADDAEGSPTTTVPTPDTTLPLPLPLPADGAPVGEAESSTTY